MNVGKSAEHGNIAEVLYHVIISFHYIYQDEQVF